MRGNVRIQIVLRTFAIAILLGALLAGLQFFGPSLGVERSVGLWIWAASGLALTLSLFLPLLRRAGVSAGRVAVFAVALLLLGAGAYLYLAQIVLPEAAARAAAARAVNAPAARPK